MTENIVIGTMAQKRLLRDICDIIRRPLTEHGIYYVHDDDDMLKGYAMLIGPPDTCYADGIYFFIFTYPPDYPYKPPRVTFHTRDGVTRFHPNLYRNGKVCLSLINTWKGEQWTSCQTIKTVLLTLVSILHNKPLLCEPGRTEQHIDFKPYNRIIEYKNIDIAIIGIAMKRNLPDNFVVFFPFFRNNILKEKDNIIARIEKLQEKFDQTDQYVRTYNMRTRLDYKKLKKNMNLAIKKLAEN